MAFSCGFFDAKNKDRVYTAEDFTSYLSSLICSGILDTYGQCFKVTAHNTLSVTIGTGKAWINGHFFENDANYELDLSSYVSGSENRHAVIGICCDTDVNTRSCSLVVKSGVTQPVFSNFGSQSYLTLASIYLPAGTKRIIDSDITDYRDDENKCGYVKCILGKCGISKLMEQLEALEKRTAALETQLGMVRGNQRVIAYPNAAIGLTAIVGSMGGKITGLMGIVAPLETIKMEDE